MTSDAQPMPRFYAHRFGRTYGPDSAPSTLEHAFTEPLDGLETDCVLTADGRLALLHDPILSHGTDLSGWAIERSAADIAASHVKDATGAVTAEHPLLLEDLWPLVEGHELVVQLEVKALCDEDLANVTARAVVDALAETPPPPGVSIEIISFWPGTLPIAAAAGWDTRIIIAAPYSPGAMADWAVTNAITGVILEAPFWGRSHVDTWRDAGLSLMSGVCNDVEIAELVMGYGPEIFSTDRPHELRSELRASRS